MRLLARSRVGTKLMLLAVLPAGSLVGVAILAGLADWREARRLRDFRDAVRTSFVLTTVTDDLSREQLATVVAQFRRDGTAQKNLAATRAATTRALTLATRRGAGQSDPVDVAREIAVARRQRAQLLREATTGNASPREIGDGYGAINARLLGAVRALDDSRPTRASGRAADAYLAILLALEAAERERTELASLFGSGGSQRRGVPTASRWERLEAAELDDFREHAPGSLAAAARSAVASAAGARVARLRDELSQRGVRRRRVSVHGAPPRSARRSSIVSASAGVLSDR